MSDANAHKQSLRMQVFKLEKLVINNKSYELSIQKNTLT